jgi:hypothetical protein
MGWSNGGYMVMYAAHLFRAIAPISGFQVEPMVPPNRPTALFLHHAVDDHHVQYTGCCTDSSKPKCCCRLSTLHDQCTSAQDKFHEWSEQINHCQSGHENIQISISNANVTCITSNGCDANTTFCTHQKGGHFNRPSHSKAFPMTLDIAEFFARDACLIHGGTWSLSVLSSSSSGSSNRCLCPQDRTGIYCLVGSDEEQQIQIFAKHHQDHLDISHENDPVANNGGLGTFFMIGIFLVAASMLFLFKSRQRKKRYHGFNKVSNVEMT